MLPVLSLICITLRRVVCDSYAPIELITQHPFWWKIPIITATLQRKKKGKLLTLTVFTPSSSCPPSIVLEFTLLFPYNAFIIRLNKVTFFVLFKFSSVILQDKRQQVHKVHHHYQLNIIEYYPPNTGQREYTSSFLNTVLKAFCFVPLYVLSNLAALNMKD